MPASVDDPALSGATTAGGDDAASDASVEPALDPREAHALHDPGGRVLLRLPGDVVGSARFSACGRYRFELGRDWTPEGTTPRTVMFVGMNPSTARADMDDPTCFKELKYARRWGYTRYLKGNMIAWRATSPDDMPADLGLAVSPDSLPALLDMAARSEAIVLGFGKMHKRFQAVVQETLQALAATGKPLLCLRRNKDGSAQHPLYLKDDCQPFPFLLES